MQKDINLLYKFLLIIFLIFSSTVSSQSSKIDSMKSELKNYSGEEQIKIMLDIASAYGRDHENRLYYAQTAYEQSLVIDYPFGVIEGAANIAYAYYFDKKYARAINYFSIAVEKAKKEDIQHLFAVNNYRLGLAYQNSTKNDSAKFHFKVAARSWETDYEGHELDFYYATNALGLIYWRTSVYDSAIIYYRQAKKMADLLGGKKRIAAISNNIGVIYWQWGIHDKAIEYYFQSLELREEMQDSSGMAKLYNNIGLAHLEHKKYDLAKEYFEKGLNLSQKTGEHNTIGYSYNNLGRAAYELGKFDSALVYYKLSLEEYKFLENNDGVSLSYNDIAITLNKLKRFDLAKNYAFNAIKIARKKENLLHIGTAKKILGESFSATNNFEKGIEYFDSALVIAKEINSLVLLRDTYLELSIAYKNADNTAQYANYLNLYYETRTRIQNESSSNRLLEYQTRLETLEARQKLEEQEYLLQNRMLLLYILSVSVILLLILTLIIYRFYKSRSKAFLELNIKTEQLNQLNAAKDKIISVIAHDLKNPMGSVLGYSNMLLNDYHDLTETERVESARGIFTSIKIVFDVLENLLTWARGQRGLIKVNIESFNLADVIAKLETNLVYFADEKDINLEFGNSNFTIFSDKFFVQIVLNNLLTNAIKFTKPGGFVKFAASLEKSRLRLEITDNGVGMTDETIKDLFMVAGSGDTEGTNLEKGTGLGLIICKELVEKLNGEISVESSPGNGSTFKVVLPVKY